MTKNDNETNTIYLFPVSPSSTPSSTCQDTKMKQTSCCIRCVHALIPFPFIEEVSYFILQLLWRTRYDFCHPRTRVLMIGLISRRAPLGLIIASITNLCVVLHNYSSITIDRINPTVTHSRKLARQTASATSTVRPYSKLPTLAYSSSSLTVGGRSNSSEHTYKYVQWEGHQEAGLSTACEDWVYTALRSLQSRDYR